MPERMLASSRCRTIPDQPVPGRGSTLYTDHQLQLWTRGNTAAIVQIDGMVERQMTDEQVRFVFACARSVKQPRRGQDANQ